MKRMFSIEMKRWLIAPTASNTRTAATIRVISRVSRRTRLFGLAASPVEAVVWKGRASVALAFIGPMPPRS
jgi:hypothetical protein